MLLFFHRLAYPEHDWLHLVGLLHSLGKLLGHPKVAAEPQWAICGESFPVGCKFDSAIAFSHFFGANPDRRSRTFNTPTGMYRQGACLTFAAPLMPPPSQPQLRCTDYNCIRLPRPLLQPNSPQSHTSRVAAPTEVMPGQICASGVLQETEVSCSLKSLFAVNPISER